MRYDIKISNPHPHLVNKASLFTQIYNQYDNSVKSINFPKQSKDEWARLRIIIGEYIGNLYKHDAQATYCDLEVDVTGQQIKVSLAHDGTDFDQFNSVPVIKNALTNLNITKTEFLGTGILRGFIVEITI